MTFYANWQISGTNFDSSIDAFIKSSEYAISSKNLKRHESRINKSFKEHIERYARISGMEADNISNVFNVKIDNNINFVNTEPLVTQRYEYGYYDGTNDTNEEYYEEYMIQTSPKYFIRPAIQHTLNDIGRIIIEDAKREYNALKQQRDELL